MPRRKRKQAEFIPDTEDRRYLLALGNFMAHFATVEFVLNRAVWHFAKLKERPQIARALLGHLRVDETIDKIRRLIRGRRLRGIRIDELEELIKQVRLIAKVRNDIVHHGAFKVGRGPFVVTNRGFALSGSERTSFVGPIILQRMTDDLVVIFGRITAIAHDVISGYSHKQVRELYGGETLPAWRFKHRGRLSRNHRHRGTTRARQRPQKSFSG